MIHSVCQSIISALKINIVVETGTFVGESVALVSEWLQDIDPLFGKVAEKKPNAFLQSFDTRKYLSYPVFVGADLGSSTKLYSVDVDMEKHTELKAAFSSNGNINIIRDSSVAFLRQALDRGLISDRDRCFFYLDAHWGEKWPLRDEIREILRLKRSIIVIDDVVVPWHPLHGFDVYKTTVCGWYHIRDLFSKSDHRVYYPRKPNQDRRGTIIILVGFTDEEARFMNQLPCFSPLILKGAPFITAAVKSVMALLLALGVHDRLLRYYMVRKWGSVEKSPMRGVGT